MNLINPKIETECSFSYKGYTDSPFVIECFDERVFFDKGDILEFDIILFARTILYLSQFIYAIDTMGSYGLGHGQNKFILMSVCNEDKKAIYADGFFYKQNMKISTLKDYVDKRKESFNNIKEIDFITPFRFLKKYELIAFLDFKDILNSVYERLFILNAYSGNSIQEMIPNINGQVKVTNKEWFDIKIDSNKDKSYSKVGGIIGKVEFSEEVNLMKDYVIACELTHIGENTSFGLGKYLILGN